MPTPPPLLTESELAASLSAAADGWGVVDGELGKTFNFDDYLRGADFARAVASVAEEMNHHPEIAIGWRKVTLTIHTHSAGGLTALDFQFAAAVEQQLGDAS